MVGVEDDSPVSACFGAPAVVFLRSRGTFAACSCSLAAFWCRGQLVLRILPPAMGCHQHVSCDRLDLSLDPIQERVNLGRATYNIIAGRLKP